MTRLIALLRGINVGGHKRVPMTELCDLCRNAGFKDVVSYIQSGNLVLTGAAGNAAVKLEGAIRKRFGFAVDVIVRTAAEWSEAAEANPFAAASKKEPSRVLLLLSKAPPNEDAVPRLAERAAAGENVRAAGGAVWIHFPGGAGTSKLPGLLDRLIGSPSTMRNWTTALALRELAGSR